MDTHALLWMLTDSEEFSSEARRVVSDPEAEVMLSVASVWEMAIKLSLKLELRVPLAEFVRQALRVARLSLLPITVEHLQRVSELPFHHRDPIDRLLIAQSLVECAPLLSRDARFDAYAVRRVW